MNPRRPRSRPFFSWRGFVWGSAITAVAMAAGWLAAIYMKGPPA